MFVTAVGINLDLNHKPLTEVLIDADPIQIQTDPIQFLHRIPPEFLDLTRNSVKQHFIFNNI